MLNIKILTTCLVFLSVEFLFSVMAFGQDSETNKYQIAVYYFPNYHFDKRNEKQLGKSWTGNNWPTLSMNLPLFTGRGNNYL
jgi:hypothetical protein